MPPITLLIKPASGLCNMRCLYCFYADVAKSRTISSYGIMDIGTLEIVVKKAVEYAGRSPVTFIFQGGEPALAGLDFYRQLVMLEKKLGAYAYNSIQTNGLIIDGEWARFFAENRFLVGLSLDGTKQLHDSFRLDPEGRGTYARIKKAASALKAAGAEFNILCVVTSPLARHGAQVVGTLIKDGYKYLQFIPCIDEPNGGTSAFSLTAERWGEFLCAVFDRYYAMIKIGAPISIRPLDNFLERLSGLVPSCCGFEGKCTPTLVIESDGSVYPCDFYALDEFRLGNIREASFAELLCSEPFLKFVAESEQVDPACAGCRWYALCRGGCRRYREQQIGGGLKLNKLCAGYRRFFEYAYPRMLKLLGYIRV